MSSLTRVISSAAVGLLLGCLMATASAAQKIETAAQEPEAPADEGAPTSAGAPENDFVGDAACLTCHEALHNGFTADYQQTIHAKVFTDNNALTEQMRQGCEGCHGPGSEHVAAGGGKGNIIAFTGDGPDAIQSESEICLTCHRGGERLYWAGSIHPSRDVGCTSCHTVMRNASQRDQLAKAQVMDTCGTCHRVQRARQFRSAHMPARGKRHGEGRMDCASCHNPHGTIADSLIAQNTTNENCYQCHTDKRGPFLFEHLPVQENCLTCHDPHGTTRDKMLKLGLPRLCQSCHINTGHMNNPVSDISDRFVRGGSCMNCHPAIHGTNHPSGSALTR